MRWSLRVMVALLVCSALFVACSDESGGGGGEQDVIEDTNVEEDTATGEDTSTSEDTATDEDTATPEDTGTDEDTSTPEDTGTDTGTPEDTGLDTGGDADTGARDADTSTTDTEIADTAVDTANLDAADTGRDGADSVVVPDIDVGSGGEHSIREIRALSVNLGPGQSLPGTYRTEGVVVTAIRGSTGVYVQEPSGPKANSGLWIFFNDAQTGTTIPSNIQRGSVLNLTGTVTNYDDNNSGTNGGLLELHELSAITIASQSGTVPSPVQITDPSQIGTYAGTKGPKAESLESVLVEVSSVHVIDANPDSPQDFNEFVVGQNSGSTDGVRVDDLLYKYGSMPRQLDPSVGDQFSTIRGPLHFSYDHTKIVPREASDLQ